MDFSLAEAVNVKADTSVCLLNAPGDFEDSLGKLPPRVFVLTSLDRQYDQVHYFCAEKWNLEQTFSLLKTKVLPGGNLWVWWQPSQSGESDLTAASVGKIGKTGGMAPRGDFRWQEWSGLELVNQA